MNKPVKVNVAQSPTTEEKKEEEEEKNDDMESDIIDSVPATMKSRARHAVGEKTQIKPTYCRME